MNIDQTQRLIAHLYCAALQGKGMAPMELDACPTYNQETEEWEAKSRMSRYVPLMIWGEAGVGKSETVKWVADNLGIGFRDLRLGQLDASDLIGLPREETVYPCVLCQEQDVPPQYKGLRYSKSHLWLHILQEHKEALGGTADEVINHAVKLANSPKFRHLIDIQMAYSTPPWFPAPHTHGILFLDEVSRSHEDIENAVFQLLLDRRMHTLTLPDGWIIIAANNPPTKDYEGVRNSRDKAFRSRFLHVALDPTVDEWLRYAYDRGVDPSIRSLITHAKNQNEMLGLSPVPMQDSFPTPRTWVLLNNVTIDMDKDLIIEVAQGLVGPEAAAAWASMRMLPDDPVRARDVISSYVVRKDGSKSSQDVRKQVYKFIDYEQPVRDDEGRQKFDKDNRPLTERVERIDVLTITFDDITELLEEPLEQYQAINLVSFLNDAFRGRDEDGVFPPDFTPKRPGLNMHDIAYQYLKFWIGMPGLNSVLPYVTGLLQETLKKAGEAKKVATTRRGSRGRGRRRPGSNYGGVARLGVDYGADEIFERAAMREFRLLR